MRLTRRRINFERESAEEVSGFVVEKRERGEGRGETSLSVEDCDRETRASEFFTKHTMQHHADINISFAPCCFDARVYIRTVYFAAIIALAPLWFWCSCSERRKEKKRKEKGENIAYRR